MENEERCCRTEEVGVIVIKLFAKEFFIRKEFYLASDLHIMTVGYIMYFKIDEIINLRVKSDAGMTLETMRHLDSFDNSAGKSKP